LINCVRIITLQPTYCVPPSEEVIPEQRYTVLVNDDDDDKWTRKKLTSETGTSTGSTAWPIEAFQSGLMTDDYSFSNMKT